MRWKTKNSHLFHFTEGVLRWSSSDICSLTFTSFALSHAGQSQSLVLRVTLGVWLVSQHRQSGVTNVLFGNDRGLECNLVYQTCLKEPRLMDFYPLDFKEQSSKRKANRTLVET